MKADIITKQEKYAKCGFLILLTLQMIMMLFFCIKKQEFHIDEIYSYILSNSYDCEKLSASKDIKNHWIRGSDSFNDFVTVQPDERFAYDKTYYNNTRDAHPPLFYFVLHTVCSFFPDKFSKWLGLSVNLLTFVLTQLILLRISRMLFRESIWQLLPVALYGFSPIAVDTVLYIRMYSMLTLFTLMLFYIHLLMFEEKIKYPYLWCFGVTFLGVFTQYYFAIAAFYLALVCCIVLWKNKKIRDLLYYSVSMMSGVLLVFLVYPAALRQITGSDTNNVGNEVSSNITDFSLLKERLSAYREQFRNRMIPNWKWSLLYISILSVILIFSVILRSRSNKKIFAYNPVNAIKKAFVQTKTMYLFMTAVIVFMTVVTISHISGKFSYLRYFYNIMPIVFFLFAAAIYYFSSLFNVNRTVLSGGLIVLALISGAGTVVKKNCEYLFEYRYRVVSETVEFLADKPLVLIDKHANHVLTGNFTLLSSADMLYITDTDEISIDDLTAEVDVSDGVAVLIINNTDWSEGYIGDEVMQRLVDSSHKFESYEKYCDESYSTMYWIH